MVIALAKLKNLSKMKSPKSNGKSRRNRLCISKQQRKESTKREEHDWTKFNSTPPEAISGSKVKSTSWKRNSEKQNLPSSPPVKNTNSEHVIVSPKFRPGVLYSDVVVGGDNLSKLAKMRTLTPIQNTSPKKNSPKSKNNPTKEASEVTETTEVAAPSPPSLKNAVSKMLNTPPTSTTGKAEATASANDVNLKKIIAPPSNNAKHRNDRNSVYKLRPVPNCNILTEYIWHLKKDFNMEIPSWNYTDFGGYVDIPKFTHQFDDYNYLACEKAAFAGLRLASDGKFKS